MGATQKFQLLVESQTRGEAEIARLNATVNKLGDELARANKKIADEAVRSQVRYSDALKRMKDDTQTSLGGATKATSEGSAGFGKYATAAIAVYAAVKTAAAGFDTLIRSTGEAALEIKSLSLSTGLTIGQADKLRAAANLTGFDIRNLKEAALDLSVALKDTGGQGDQTRQLLKQLGVSAFTSTGQTRALNDVLLETFDALSKVTDTTQRVNLSRVLGGEDAAKNVQPLLAGYREANQLAAQLGFGTRDGLLKALDDSNKQLRTFDLQWEIIKGKLAEKIAPVIVPILFQTGKVLSGDRLPGSEVVDFALNAAGFATEGIGPGALSRFGAKVPSGLTDFSSASQGGARFRNGQSGSEDSLKIRADQIQKDRAGLISALSSDSLSDSARSELSKKLAALAAESVSIARRLEFIQKARAGAELVVNSSDLVNANIGSSITVGRIPSLRGRASSLPDLPVFISTQADRNAFDSSDPRGDQAITSSQIRRQTDERERELNTTYARQFVQFEERKIELLTGPGGELDAINRIYELKKAGLEQELEFGNEIFNLTERRTALDQERTLRILDLQRQRRDEARGLASEFTGSLQAGNPGGFFRQQSSRLVNQVGTNLFTGTFQRAQGVLGKIGEASGLGSLLKGTLLDPANATPVDRNTLATDRNTAAIEQATIRAVTGAGAGGGGVAGLLTAAGVPAQIFAGASGTNPLIFSNNAGTGGGVTAAPGFIGLGTDASGAVVPLSAGAGISKGAKGVGIAGLAVGGAIGAYTQFKAGGAQGALNGTAALAGAAAGIIALSGVGGPAAPIIAGVGLGLQAIASILGDPKKKRDAEINRQLDAAYYEEPTSMAFNFDRFGRGYDSNKRGDMRPIIVQNFDLIDGSGIMDRREFFADAVRQASYEGHGINRAMQEAVLPA